jgi:DNA-binding cell septation regulator SpoVG
MLITSVRVTPIKREKVLAVVRQTGGGGVFEVYHPINREARDVLEQVVIRGYESKTSDRDPVIDMPVRIGSESPDFVITAVRVKTFEEQKLRGFASMVIDDCLAVNGIKIIAGKQRRFVQMPNVRKKSGKFRDLAFPITPEVRQLIEEAVFEAYGKTIAED